MRNRKTMEELARLQRSAVDEVSIGRMIAGIENELGYPLNDAVAQLKQALSAADRASFRFAGAGLEIEAEVSRAEFENRIAEDLAQMDGAVNRPGRGRGSRRRYRPRVPDRGHVPDTRRPLGAALRR